MRGFPTGIGCCQITWLFAPPGFVPARVPRIVYHFLGATFRKLAIADAAAWAALFGVLAVRPYCELDVPDERTLEGNIFSYSLTLDKQGTMQVILHTNTKLGNERNCFTSNILGNPRSTPNKENAQCSNGQHVSKIDFNMACLI